jgi:hypothetical protein
VSALNRFSNLPEHLDNSEAYKNIETGGKEGASGPDSLPHIKYVLVLYIPLEIEKKPSICKV